ncbi:FecR family protein [Sphingobium rhizovicinum]|uniref:FecR family protein n=1 Tax=Sphingobium rhizovicinum TaxID=432308 RepID=A0ABV7NNY9_9SPHN
MTEERPDPIAPLGNQLYDDAADWFAKMRGPDAKSHEPDFKAWLARGALHRAAYNKISEIFTDSGKVDDPDGSLGGEKPRSRPGKHGLAMIALVIGLGAISAKMMFHTVLDRQEAGQLQHAAPDHFTVASAVGQIRSVALPDGSTILLDTNSEVQVAFTEKDRRLRLVRGRARFEVAHEQRPFNVAVGGGTVTARGTIFDVRLAETGRVSVALLRGAVDVTVTGSGATSRQRLHPGEKTVFAPRLEAPRPISDHETDLWTQAKGEFHDEPLLDVVTEANRYAQLPIQIGDVETEQLRVSGIFSLKDTEALSIKLAALFDLEREVSRERIILRQRQEKKIHP